MYIGINLKTHSALDIASFDFSYNHQYTAQCIQHNVQLGHSLPPDSGFNWNIVLAEDISMNKWRATVNCTSHNIFFMLEHQNLWAYCWSCFLTQCDWGLFAEWNWNLKISEDPSKHNSYHHLAECQIPMHIYAQYIMISNLLYQELLQTWNIWFTRT